MLCNNRKSIPSDFSCFGKSLVCQPIALTSFYTKHNDIAFVYNNRELEDGERVIAAIKSSEGKRLMYKEPIMA